MDILQTWRKVHGTFIYPLRRAPAPADLASCCHCPEACHGEMVAGCLAPRCSLESDFCTVYECQRTRCHVNPLGINKLHGLRGQNCLAPSDARSSISFPNVDAMALRESQELVHGLTPHPPPIRFWTALNHMQMGWKTGCISGSRSRPRAALGPIHARPSVELTKKKRHPQPGVGKAARLGLQCKRQSQQRKCLQPPRSSDTQRSSDTSMPRLFCLSFACSRAARAFAVS